MYNVYVKSVTFLIGQTLVNKIENKKVHKMQFYVLDLKLKPFTSHKN